MGYSDHNDDPTSAKGTSTVPARYAIGTINGLIGILVRLVGLGLLAIGLWISAMVVVEAWALYRDPGRIQPFAVALEQGTQIDAVLQSLSVERGGPNVSSGTAVSQPKPKPKLSLSFLLAWFVVPVLLFTAGYLAMSAARVGGQLALNPGSWR